MRKIKIFKVASLLLMGSLAILGGCKYDVAEPQWYTEPYVEPTDKPTITSINPVSATPGVNYLTVSGTNFNLVADTNVFIDDLNGNVINPEITQKSATSITFRRPTVLGNCIIKLNPHAGSVVKST